MILTMLRILLLSVFYLMFFFQTSYSEIIKNIEIEGNKRITKESIILFGDIKLNENVDSDEINLIIKKLYETNFFEDVSVRINQNTLKISLIENQIIQRVTFEGIKTKKLREKLYEVIILKDKSSFVKFKARNDIRSIKNLLKNSGYYFVEVKSSTIKNSNNTIDLVYDIKLGEKALIKKIKFIGDKKFKDRKLRSIIVSEENKFWKFISRKKYLDTSRINLDIRLLRNFYINKGYYSVNIQNSSAKFYDDNKFDLIFNINSGEKFYFNNLNLVLPNDYNNENFKEINEILNSLKDQTYSYKKIENILDEIDKIALLEQYEFINAEVEEKIVSNNKLDFSIIIKETEKFYVERINIFGNSITREKVIRDVLLVDEGDAYNQILHNKSINNIKSKNIFKTVSSEILDGSIKNNKIINIEIEEKPTGEITAGAGVGTSGTSIGFSVKENNYMGKGIKLKASLQISEESVRGIISSTNPNFNYTDKTLSTSLQSTVTDRLSGFGYKSTKTGATLGTEFEQYKDFYIYPSFSSFYEDLETNSSASANLKKQKGNYFDTVFAYRLTYDKRNQSYQPSDGFRSSFAQTLPVVAENNSVTSSYEFNKYHEFIDDMVGTFTFYAKTVQSLDDEDVRISKRIYLSGRRLRGFEPGKIGPKDGSDYIGGNYLTSVNISTTLPQLLPTSQNTDFKLFFDMGNVWGVDYSDTINDSNKIRSSTGLSIDWFTPIGPLNFSLSQAITKAASDVTESFRFNIGTTF